MGHVRVVHIYPNILVADKNDYLSCYKLITNYSIAKINLYLIFRIARNAISFPVRPAHRI